MKYCSIAQLSYLRLPPGHDNPFFTVRTWRVRLPRYQHVTVTSMPKTSNRHGIAMVIIAGITALALSGCDATSGVTGTSAEHQVTVIGFGQVQGTPNILTADVDIEFVEPDVRTAMNQTNERQQAVIDVLGAAGVDAQDISTTTITVQPQYSAGANIDGYRSSNSINVTIRDLNAAGQILASIAETGADATRIRSVHYSIDDDSALVNDARARAFEDAKNRAQHYARLSGLSLGPMISLSESPADTSLQPPSPLPRSAMTSDVPVQPGQRNINFTITTVWELR